MCRLLSDLHQLRSIYIYKKGEEVQQNTSSHSEVKCVDCNLIYINSDLFISTKKEKWCNNIFGSLQKWSNKI